MTGEFRNQSSFASDRIAGRKRYTRPLLGSTGWEALEQRLLLSVSVTQEGEHLYIRGDDQADEIHVADVGGGYINVATPGSDGLPELTTFKGVTHIMVQAGGGDDTIRYAAGPRQSVDRGFFDVFADLALDTGAGNDAAYIKYDGIKGELAAKVYLGQGDDRIELDAKASPDLDPAAETVHLYLKLDAGDGADRAKLSFFDVFADVSADLGEGTNAAYIKFDGVKGDAIVGDPTDRPDANLDIASGDGDDAVALLLPAVQKIREAAARMNLGGGNDVVRIQAASPALDLDIAAGDGNDAVLIGLLLPAVQKVRDAAARVDLGAGNDTFQMHATGAGDAARAGEPYRSIKLTLDAGAGNDRIRASFFDVFTEASIDLGDGNDSATLRAGCLKIGDIKGESAAREGAGFDLDIKAGDGNDAVLIGLLLPAVQKVREAAARVDLGAGNDTMHTDIITGAGPGGGPLVRFHADGGEGNDAVASTFSNVTLDVVLSGGAGNDRIAADGQYRALPAAENVPSRILLDGGDGNDVLTLRIGGNWVDPATGMSLLKALVDGGPGRDTALISDGVETINVEKVFDLSPRRGKAFSR